MKYTVVWSDPATDRLADIYNRASDRQAIRAASDQIDLELKRDAQRKGIPVSGNRRILRIPPLAVLFTVDTGDCMVRVVQVARVP
jgi:hypothetical protein